MIMSAVKAQLKHLRIAPRKVRLVADSIRTKNVKEAIRILSFLPKRASLPMKKLLQSAEANAKNNFQMESADLYVAKIWVDEGPVLKRYSPRAMGRATLIRKKTSHITVVLDEKKGHAQKTAGAPAEKKTARAGKQAAAPKKEPKKIAKPAAVKKETKAKEEKKKAKA